MSKYPSAATVALVFSQSDVTVDENDVLTTLPNNVFRVNKYQPVVGAPLGSSPIQAASLLILESSDTKLADAADLLPSVDAANSAIVVMAHRPETASDHRESPLAARHSSLLVVLCRNTAAGRDDDFLRWYEDVHIPEVIGTKTYQAAARFDIETEALPRAGASVLSLWATGSHDAGEAFTSLLSHNAEMTMWPDVDGIHIASYRFVGAAVRAVSEI